MRITFFRPVTVAVTLVVAFGMVGLSAIAQANTCTATATCLLATGSCTATVSKVRTSSTNGNSHTDYTDAECGPESNDKALRCESIEYRKPENGPAVRYSRQFGPVWACCTASGSALVTPDPVKMRELCVDIKQTP